MEHVVRATRYQRTRDGKIIYNFSTDPVAPTVNPKGQDVVLTIDAAIQHVCEKRVAQDDSRKRCIARFSNCYEP